MSAPNKNNPNDDGYRVGALRSKSGGLMPTPYYNPTTDEYGVTRTSGAPTASVMAHGGNLSAEHDWGAFDRAFRPVQTQPAAAPPRAGQKAAAQAQQAIAGMIPGMSGAYDAAPNLPQPAVDPSLPKIGATRRGTGGVTETLMESSRGPRWVPSVAWAPPPSNFGPGGALPNLGPDRRVVSFAPPPMVPKDKNGVPMGIIPTQKYLDYWRGDRGKQVVSEQRAGAAPSRVLGTDWVDATTRKEAFDIAKKYGTKGPGAVEPSITTPLGTKITPKGVTPWWDSKPHAARVQAAQSAQAAELEKKKGFLRKIDNQNRAGELERKKAFLSRLEAQHRANAQPVKTHEELLAEAEAQRVQRAQEQALLDKKQKEDAAALKTKKHQEWELKEIRNGTPLKDLRKPWSYEGPMS